MPNQMEKSLDEKVGFSHGFNFECGGEQYNLLTMEDIGKGKKTYGISIGKPMSSRPIFRREKISKEELKGMTDFIKFVTAGQGTTIKKLIEALEGYYPEPKVN